jgi:hypothetical protein
MKQFFPRLRAWLLGAVALGMAGAVQAQGTPQVQNGYRNLFSLQPGGAPPPAPSLDVDPRVRSNGQFMNGSPFGGWKTGRVLAADGSVLSGSVEDVPGPATLRLPSSPAAQLQSAQVGRPIVARQPTYFYGEVIPRPMVDDNGQAVSPEQAFLPEPDNVGNGQFYYSPHARRVFATQPGVVAVRWKFRDPARVPATMTVTYVISSAPIPGREAKRIFWTEKGFGGPVVSIPEGPVSAVNIRYSAQLPATVATEFSSPYVVAGDPAASPAPELRTFWYSPADKSLHAYNREGRVFVEFLGADNRETGVREFLGTEVVEVIREVTPALVNVHVGERILPHDGDLSLRGRVVSGLVAERPLVHVHGNVASNEIEYYAIRTTAPTTPPGKPTGEITFYWLRKGALGLQWPRYYDTYVSTWPDEMEAYTRYVRPDSAVDASAPTAIKLHPDNASQLVFQDDPEGLQSVLEEGNAFHTTLTLNDPSGRALIRHTSNGQIWFERVYSEVSTTTTGYNAPVAATVGQRIEPPAGHEDAVGYIRQVSGTAFDPTAYLNPFEAGFEEARSGAIIPVNALEDMNELEVWWFKKSSPPAGSAIKPNYYPVSVGRYQIAWPANPREIVMASNSGTGDLASEMASGIIYTQNQRREPGFNPNEEHAIMAAGRAWALRDDLNMPTTSEPYVLVRYRALDGRPAIEPFKVLREKPADNIVFNYQAEAGKILQAPMPLPILPLPLEGKRVRNTETTSAENDPHGHAGAPAHYGRYTYEDRKGIHWVYRGPHTDTGVGEFRMRYYYKMMAGFYVPDTETEIAVGADAVEEAQPALGTILPYLRPYNNGVDAADGYIGEHWGSEAAEIVFRPVWPEFAPELRLGETLTMPKFGLPAVRGNTSLGVLYQQSVAEDDTPSARIFDPTRAKKFALGETGQLEKLPGSVFTSEYRGKTYFPNLPPHLAQRFFFDPNEGEDGALTLIGKFNDEAFGEDYLDLNVLGEQDMAALKDLCVNSDQDKSKWNNAIDGLETTMEIFHEDPEVPGKYVASKPVDYTNDLWNYINNYAWVGSRQVKSVRKELRTRTVKGKQQKYWVSITSYRTEFFRRKPTFIQFHLGIRGGQLAPSHLAPAYKWIEDHIAELFTWKRAIAGTPLRATRGAKLEADFRATQELLIPEPITAGPSDLAEINDENTAVDSYALSASGGGSGYVVLIAGNGRAFTPEEEPVALHVIKVSAPVYRGEVKPIEPQNPLAEKLTLQHSGDFAGHPEEYEFEWRYAPPVDGLPPRTFTFDRVLPAWGGPWSQTPVGGAAFGVSLPGAININHGADAAVGPQSVLERSFSFTQRPFRFFLSLALGPNDSVEAYVNNALVASHGIAGVTDSPTIGKPTPDFMPLPLLFEIPVGALVEGQNTLRLALRTTAAADAPPTYIDAKLEALTETEAIQNWIQLGVAPGEAPGSQPGSVVGKNRHVVQGAGIFVLTDNYFITRYRPRDPEHAGYEPNGGWSKWTDPALAEGWIKRALRGINPFNQRVIDLYSNDVNTDVSLVTQAGARWEGDIALNLENIDSFGLIEIYETILRRGKALSIEGNPPINYPPANDALLLAAGYLNDLYQLLGNEAQADAANPTIAFNVDNQFGDVSTSLFAFKGQVASVLDEELSLLRGRDDFLPPGARTAPVYNRLVWNYTRGIDSGEAIYALNYNLKDLDADGVVGGKDAAKAFPQGHGDAYGHYLTALTGYYGLLWNSHFEWTPRSEAVNVLGKPVAVDYLDERKFAAAAAAWVKTAAQTAELTYRSNYTPAAETSGTWTHLQDGRYNDRTGNTRHWGVDDWSAKGGMGAYFHWATANSTLPAVDPDPNHEGIQKIDRTTIPELAEIVSQADAIQRSQDTADLRLNPLGLGNGAVPFDISPAQVDAGKTHYEQVYDRAVDALRNAAAAFNNAKSSTQNLRRQEESLAAARDTIAAQERAFTAQLVDYYGRPYPDDIGPGRSYKQGYEGPDILHFMFSDNPELFHDFEEIGSDGEPFTLSLEQQFFENNPTRPIFEKESAQFELESVKDFLKPEDWAGRRPHPGKLQAGISQLMEARVRLYHALEDYGDFEIEMRRLIRVYESTVDSHNTITNNNKAAFAVNRATKAVLLAMDRAKGMVELLDKSSDDVVDAINEAFPKTVGLATDATAPARGVIKTAAALKAMFGDTGLFWLDTISAGLEYGLETKEGILALEEARISWKAEHAQMIYDLKSAFQDMEDMSRTLDFALRGYQNARENLATLSAEALRIQDEREVFRQKAAALIQGYRTKDFGFRAFRNEALESYKSLYDLAARYTYMAAKAYDYETGLANTANNRANTFFQNIVRSRSLGVFADGRPQPAGSRAGDPGLSGALAGMNSDWAVVKSRLGFNNPDKYRTTFSLRREKERIVNGADGDTAWKDFLAMSSMDNILEDPDVTRYCMQVNSGGALTEPGFVIPFQTTIASGYNFFGLPLAGGDEAYSPSSFATKIRSTGIAFTGYIGMASPTSTGGSLTGAGANSPGDPATGFTDPNALGAAPYVYLIAAGADSMRAPALGDSPVVRSWQIEDQAIPLPFDIGGAMSATSSYGQGNTLAEAFTIRKHQAFRAVPDGTVFSSAPGFTNSRLIGRSVWNTRWKLVIPGRTLLADPKQGMRVFRDTVTDIKLHLDTYSYSGN